MNIHPLARRTAVKLGIVVAMSIGAGIGTLAHPSTYQRDGDFGIYAAGVGIERSSSGHVSVWVCGDGDVPSWRCPADEPIADHEPAEEESSTAFDDGWQPVTVQLAMSLNSVYPREDWSGCVVWYGDTTIVQCPGGWEVTS